MQFWLLPGTCVVCKRLSGRERDLCANCEALLPRVARPCLRCGLAMPAPLRQTVCGACLLNPPPFVCCIAPLAWAPPVDGLVAGFKYHARLQNGRVLAPFLAEALRDRYCLPTTKPQAYRQVQGACQDSQNSQNSQSGSGRGSQSSTSQGSHGSTQGSRGSTAAGLRCSTQGSAAALHPPDRILPVPLHSARLRARGYNQSTELGSELSRHLGIPLDADSLLRHRPTPPQRGLPAQERRRNLRGAFALRDPQALAGVRRVALLDDVVTTMSTAREIAGVLRAAGVEEVHLWALARA